MLILFGYILTLVVRFISSASVIPSERSDVTVKCTSCTDGDSNLAGIVGENLEITYNIKNTDIFLLTINYNTSTISITNEIINKKEIKDKRLTIVNKLEFKENSIQFNITLKKLVLEDGIPLFKYSYTLRDTTNFKWKDIIDVKAPPRFVNSPNKTLKKVKEGEEHKIKFSVYGKPKPRVTIKIGSEDVPAEVTVVNSTSKHTYDFSVELVLKKEHCGYNIAFIFKSFRTILFNSTINLSFKPDVVEKVQAKCEGTNLSISWKQIEYGICMVQYNVKRLVDGANETNTRSNESIIFYNAIGNNSISVSAEVNGKRGSYSDPIYRNMLKNGTCGTSGTGKVKGSGGGNNTLMIVLIIIFIILVVIVIVFVYFKKDVIKKWGQRKVGRDAGDEQQQLERLSGDQGDQGAANQYADVVHFTSKNQQQQPPPDQTIYAELGPGGGRTGQRPVVQESNYATARTDGVYYPELQKSHQNPVVGSTTGKPTESSEYDLPSGVVV